MSRTPTLFKVVMLTVLVVGSIYVLIAGPVTFIYNDMWFIIHHDKVGNDFDWYKNVGSSAFLTVLFVFWVPALLHFINTKRFRRYCVVFIWALPVLAVIQVVGGTCLHEALWFGEGVELAGVLALSGIVLALFRKYCVVQPSLPPDATPANEAVEE